VPSATVGSLDLARRHAMLRFEEGEIPEAEAELSQLIASLQPASTPAFGQLLYYYLHQDRATVRRRANQWDAALTDLWIGFGGMFPFNIPSVFGGSSYADLSREADIRLGAMGGPLPY
jgi:hypothetical protein